MADRARAIACLLREPAELDMARRDEGRGRRRADLQRAFEVRLRARPVLPGEEQRSAPVAVHAVVGAKLHRAIQGGAGLGERAALERAPALE